MSKTRSSYAAALLAALAIAGCGSAAAPPIPSSGRHEAVTGSAVGQIVLSATGAQRIGVQTETAQAVARSHDVLVPYSAIVYDPSGKTYAFTSVAPLTYVEVPVTVDRIAGNRAYLVKGPKAGAQVVTVGAEELYGVQTGVLAQT
jgi:hypothetical protein